MPIIVPGQRNAPELALFATSMAQLNPAGFRQPGRRPGSTSLVERLAVAAGQLEPEPLYRPSARGEQKRRRRAETRAKIEAERRAEAEARALRAELFG